MITLTRQDDLYILDLGEGDNRFNGDTVAAMAGHLDEVAEATAPAALLTVATGKIWSNGLDLDHLAALGDDFMPFLADVEGVFARLLRLPVPTIAVLQGHTFAGGAMFALAHDVRLIREDRGYLCLPEVDLGMTFTPGMAALIAAKLPQPALQRAAILGERLAAPEALALGAIDGVAPLDELRGMAEARATALAAKASPTLRGLRRNFYGSVLTALDGGR